MTEPIPPVIKRVEVPLAPDAAFDLFTRHMGRWWPLDRHALSAMEGNVAKDVRIEPFIGGKVLETKADGTVAPWATVTDWTPGRSFSVDWFVGRSEEDATRVSVRFAQVEGGTAVELTHDGFERLGEAGVPTAKGYDNGWNHVLETCFRNACLKESA